MDGSVSPQITLIRKHKSGPADYGKAGIWIDPEVRDRLKKLKGDLSYSEFIELLLDIYENLHAIKNGE